MNSKSDALNKAGYQITEGSRREKHIIEAKTQNTGLKTNISEKKSEIPEGYPEDYTATAERVILEIKKVLDEDYNKLTTSKIRNILSMVNEIYNQLLKTADDVLSDEIQSRIAYMKVRLVYECGREPNVIKPFVEKAGLLEIISDIGASRKKFMDFSRYMEALVAYHRFYGGKD